MLIGHWYILHYTFPGTEPKWHTMLNSKSRCRQILILLNLEPTLATIQLWFSWAAMSRKYTSSLGQSYNAMTERVPTRTTSVSSNKNYMLWVFLSAVLTQQMKLSALLSLNNYSSHHFGTYFPFQFISSYLNPNELLNAAQCLLQGMLAVQFCYFMQRLLFFLVSLLA